MSSTKRWEEIFADCMYGGSRTARVPGIVAFLWQKLGLEVGSTVLDMCCGRGHAAIEFAMRGANVVAIDLSSTFTNNLNLAAGALGLSVRAQDGDVVEATPCVSACASVILWNSLGNELVGKDADILAAAHKSTHCAGSLALEIVTLEEMSRNPRRVVTRSLGDGRSFRRYRNLDIRTGLMRGTWELLDAHGACIAVSTFDRRVYRHQEITKMVSDAGWRNLTDYSVDTSISFVPTGTLFVGVAECRDGLYGGADCIRCRGAGSRCNH